MTKEEREGREARVFVPGSLRGDNPYHGEKWERWDYGWRQADSALGDGWSDNAALSGDHW